MTRSINATDMNLYNHSPKRTTHKYTVPLVQIRTLLCSPSSPQDGQQSTTATPCQSTCIAKHQNKPSCTGKELASEPYVSRRILIYTKRRGVTNWIATVTFVKHQPFTQATMSSSISPFFKNKILRLRQHRNSSV